MKIALITLARKNSKRIKNKNYKLFAGYPLIGYTLGIMEGMSYDSYLFTDYDDIKKYTKKNHPSINIIHMESKYAQDKHILMESIQYMHKKINADLYVLLQPTSPIRFLPIIMNAIDFMVNNEEMKSGFSVYQLPKKYYWLKDPVNFDQNERDGNGCEKQELYVENGSFYIFRKQILEDNEKHVIVKPYCQFVDKFIFDIDTEEEWNQAERYYEILKYKHNEGKL